MIKIDTSLCKLLGIQYPIIEGGMGEKQGAKATAAISNAGALGCVRQSPFVVIGEDPREVMRAEIAEAKALSNKPFAVNVRVAKEELAHEESSQILDLVLQARKDDPELAEKLVAIVTSAGDCTPFVDKIKSAGLKLIHKVTNLRQALRAEQAGADALIAMGQAAAGHIGSKYIDGIVLIPLIAERVNIPVFASGGFCDGRSFIAALALGAEGIEMGTRFMASQESGFHEAVKSTIVKAGSEDTTVGVGWFSSVRIYNNNFPYMQRSKTQGLPEEELKTTNPQLKEELSRDFFRGIRFDQIEKGDMENCVLPLGQVAGRIDSIPTIEEIIRGIVEEAQEIANNITTKVQDIA